MTELMIILGVPDSGKTTLAKRLAGEPASYPKLLHDMKFWRL